jgi:hypothetical protein
MRPLVLAVACLACQASCKGAASETNPTGRREQGDEAFFGHIPADSPYVLASLEPIPRSYWRRFEPVLRAMFDTVPPPNPAEDPAARFGAALLRELGASLDKGGLRKRFGISPEGRYALYGIGVIPVLRHELADSRALLATLERLQRESGFAFPVASLGGRRYWRFAEDKALFVAAVVGGHLVLAAGPTAAVDKAMPLILGTELPKPGMGDGAPIRKVIRRHGFAAYGVGYIDTQDLLKAFTSLLGAAASEIPPLCMEDVAQLARRFPRLAFGYDEISDRRISMRVVLETDASLAARLKQIAVEVPGLVGGLPPDRPMLAIGLGVDVAMARPLAIDAADGIAHLALSCGAPDVAVAMVRARAALSTPLPPWLDEIDGGLVSANSVWFGADGKPNRFEGYAIVASDDPARSMTSLRQWAPAGHMLDIAADGKFHDLVPAGTVPGLVTLRAAIKPGALVAALGAGMAEAAERALRRTGPSPLLYIAYDYQRLRDREVGGSDELHTPSVLAFRSMLGMSSIWAYPTDQGLALAISMELK